ncbi:MAG: hypothetical protein U5K54_23220 [Cytophagales bacterium]|nr:hypothetical protein [Cytophagales bacterium]
MSESDLTRKLKEKDNRIGSLMWQIDILTYQTKIIENNPFVPKAKKFDFAIWTSEEMIKYLNKDQKKGAESIQKLNEQVKKYERQKDSFDAKLKLRKIDN